MTATTTLAVRRPLAADVYRALKAVNLDAASALEFSIAVLESGDFTPQQAQDAAAALRRAADRVASLAPLATSAALPADVVDLAQHRRQRHLAMAVTR